MNLIVAVDKNWAIGNENKLLCHLPSDLKHFKNMTINKPVIMGRKTLESFPGGKPLTGRTNIVFSNSLKNEENIVIVRNIADLKELSKSIDMTDSFVIGGQTIYELLLPYTEFAYITKIDHAFEADVYFPNLDIKSGWYLEERLSIISENNLRATIYKYKNFNVLSI